MPYDLKIIDEPTLEFGYGQHLIDPRDGLSLFGPCDADLPSHPAALSYGVVGTDKGMELFFGMVSSHDCRVDTCTK